MRYSRYDPEPSFLERLSLESLAMALRAIAWLFDLLAGD